MVPPFSRYAVMPVARKVCQQVVTDGSATMARLLNMRSASLAVIRLLNMTELAEEPPLI